MHHPFLSFPAHLLPRLFWPLFALTLVLTFMLAVVGAPLTNPVAPQGIVSFEFAGSVERARGILDSWRPVVQLRAAFIQGLDFLYLLVYSTTIALGCIWAARTLARWSGMLSSVGLLLAFAMGLAAAFDALENVALVILLFGSLTTPWPQIAWVCAAVKFALIFAGLVFVFFAAVLRVGWPKA